MTVGSHTDQEKPGWGCPLSLQRGPAQSGHNLQPRQQVKPAKTFSTTQAYSLTSRENHSLFDKNSRNPETPGKTPRPSYLNILPMNNKRLDRE